MHFTKGFFFLSLFFLSSCSLSPKKEVPNVLLPESYSGIKTGQDETPIALSVWWTQFQDPLLDELVEKASKRNFDIRSALEYLNQTRAGVSLKTADLLPQVGAFGAAAKIKTSQDIAAALAPPIPSGIIPSMPTPFTGVRNFFIAGFDASWEIDFFGKNISAKKQALYTAMGAEEQARYTELVVIAEVVKLYTEIRTIQHKIAISKEKIKIFESLLQLTTTLSDCGLASRVLLENN